MYYDYILNVTTNKIYKNYNEIYEIWGKTKQQILIQKETVPATDFNIFFIF